MEVAQLLTRHRLHRRVPVPLRRVALLRAQAPRVIRRHRLRNYLTSPSGSGEELGIATQTTIGIDIGTTSVKAIAADGDGNVVASTRIPHAIHVPDADSLEHDVDEAWRNGVRRAYADVSRDLDVVGVNVAAMVPSLGALHADGSAAGPGLLYGDRRGRRAGVDGANPVESGELLGFLGWLRTNCPDAERFWPAQATANHELCGRAALDTTTAFTAYPLFDGAQWDPALSAEAGVEPAQLAEIVAGVEPAGRVGGADGPLLGGGTIDAMGEQIVAGADEPGDVLVICGTTLITWSVMGEEWIEKPGLWTIPHTAPKRLLIGGPSNAGGLFLNWACALAGNGVNGGGDEVDPNDVPIWLPYVRGERTPLHRHDLRASLHGLNLTHGPAHLRRAAYEASGFVVRHHLDLAGDAIAPQRIVATGGGTRVEPWLDALAACTGLPVDVVAVPEGAALGSAFIARCVAGLEAQMSDGSRWARVARRIEPDDRWAAAAKVRYEQFRGLTAGAAASGDVM
ncbi:MAG TPA: FGGY-family carbohydrate kinase [Acidimicrobiales bacterium]|nr:FGGY-family carbohydrate kinase [Acidimicrobiales bacterium]